MKSKESIRTGDETRRMGLDGGQARIEKRMMVKEGVRTNKEGGWGAMMVKGGGKENQEGWMWGKVMMVKGEGKEKQRGWMGGNDGEGKEVKIYKEGGWGAMIVKGGGEEKQGGWKG